MGLGVKRTFLRRALLMMTVLSLIASRTSCTRFEKLNSLFSFVPHCWSTSYTFESYNDLSITTIALLLSALVTINFSSVTFLCNLLITPCTLLFIWGRGRGGVTALEHIEIIRHKNTGGVVVLNRYIPDEDLIELVYESQLDD